MRGAAGPACAPSRAGDGMQTRLLFMLILAVDHAAVNAAVSAWYRRSFCRDDNFLGARAPDAVQRFFGRAVFTVMVYYAVVILALVLQSDLGGLISYVRWLDRTGGASQRAGSWPP